MIVTEIISGSADAVRSSNTSSIATIAGLGVERVDDRLEQQQVAAAVDQAAHLLLERVAQLVERDVRNAGLLTSGEIDRMRLVGPIEPATKRGRSGVRAVHSSRGRAREPRAFDVQLVDERLERRSRPARSRCC